MKKLLTVFLLCVSFASYSQVVRPEGFSVVLCDGHYDYIKYGKDSIMYFKKVKGKKDLFVGVSFQLYGVTFWMPKYRKECK